MKTHAPSCGATAITWTTPTGLRAALSPKT
jgi:hypothetical protein